MVLATWGNWSGNVNTTDVELVSDMRQVNPYKRTAGENALLIGGILVLTVGTFFFMMWIGLFAFLFTIPVGAVLVYLSGRRVKKK